MIQRKQTLFLLQLAFLSVSLLFIPIQAITINSVVTPVSLTPVAGLSGNGHFAAIGLNMIGLLVTILTIFLYKNRNLQVKLCYALMIIYLVLPLMMAFCPFIKAGDGILVEKNIFGYIVCAVAIITAWLAARFVKKDIELLKSADRIR